VVVGPPLIAPYTCPQQNVPLDDWCQYSGVVSTDDFHKELASVEVDATNIHYERTAQPCRFPGFRRATTVSSTATMWPGQPSWTGLAMRSAQQTSRMKLYQLTTVFSSSESPDVAVRGAGEVHPWQTGELDQWDAVALDGERQS